MESAPRSLSLFAASAFAEPEMLQAFAVGLHREAASFAAGRKDGEEGAPFRPLEDWSPERLREIVRSGDQVAMNRILSYALGRGRVGPTGGAQHAR
jgi:hypothetical protein